MEDTVGLSHGHEHEPFPDISTFIAGMWTNKRTLSMSPIWKKLPVELVQNIFDHLIKNYISDCFFDEGGQFEFDANGRLVNASLSETFGTITTGVLVLTWHLRNEPLFRRQRHLIERHYQNEWLSRVTLYLCLNAEIDMPILRYFHFQESDDPLDTMVRISPDNQKVTFFLYKPELCGFVTDPETDYTLDQLMEDLLAAWDDYRGQRINSYLIVGIRSRNLQRDVEMDFNPRFDIHNSPNGTVNVEGVEVSEDGRYIRFNWEDFITAMVTWQLHESMRQDLEGSIDGYQSE